MRPSPNCSPHRRSSRKFCRVYGAAAVLTVAAFFAGLLLGSVPLTEGGELTDTGRTILLYSRLPRVLSCLLAGGALAVSGAIIQGVLANRLASPSIIGVNAGAGLAVTICTATGLWGGWQLSLFSFLGAFLAVMLVTLGARRTGASRGTVILAGVALNSLLNAISTTIVTLNPDVGVMSNDFKVGDFSAITYPRLIPAGILISVALVLALTLYNELDVIGLGEESAHGLGMNTTATRTLLLLLAALLAGGAVSMAGLLSFVGLIVPHVIRLLGIGQSRHLLPLCALTGGSFVTLCDLVARTAFTPYEIPVGIIMSVIGAPFFLWLLLHRKGGSHHA